MYRDKGRSYSGTWYIMHKRNNNYTDDCFQHGSILVIEYPTIHCKPLHRDVLVVPGITLQSIHIAGGTQSVFRNAADLSSYCLLILWRKKLERVADLKKQTVRSGWDDRGHILRLSELSQFFHKQRLPTPLQLSNTLCSSSSLGFEATKPDL